MTMIVENLSHLATLLAPLALLIPIGLMGLKNKRLPNTKREIMPTIPVITPPNSDFNTKGHQPRPSKPISPGGHTRINHHQRGGNGHWRGNGA